MTQRDLNREVAAATGETVSTIERLGFVPLTPLPVEREPLVIDWDEQTDFREPVTRTRRKRQPAIA
jgi:hypothetical protein